MNLRFTKENENTQKGFSDEKSILTYLYFGYFPEPEIKLNDLFTELKDKKVSKTVNISPNFNLSQFVTKGTKILRRVFKEVIPEKGNMFHVVPLSGGLDSRAILCGLLENINHNKIQAVIFGMPGTWDYELGQLVARAAGVHYDIIDLSSTSWKWRIEDLIDTATRCDRPIWVFDAHVNRQIPLKFGTGCIYHSGFMGDPLSGSHLLQEDNNSWEEAKKHFIARNRYVHSINLTKPRYNPKEFFSNMSSPLPPKILCYDEQLDFGIRQLCLIKHIVLHVGYQYITPFLHIDWVNFILNAPRQYRREQYLYKEILKSAYPMLFSLPTKTNYGLPLEVPLWKRAIRKGEIRFLSTAKRVLPFIYWGSSPLTNYIDFDYALRKQKDLKNIVYESLQELKKRNIIQWINIDNIWIHHQRGWGNYADAIILLASLEIYMKVYDSIKC